LYMLEGESEVPILGLEKKEWNRRHCTCHKIPINTCVDVATDSTAVA
jgi:hypothetical protein